MLYGFEEETAELDEYENTVLLPKILAGLGTKRGANMAVTNKQMREGMAARGYPLGDARVRKIVNYIRRKRLLPYLCASSKGYWVEPDVERYMKWIGSVVGRINAMQEVVQAAIQDLPEKYRNKWD